jgi:Flp pilus assembly protein TadB
MSGSNESRAAFFILSVGVLSAVAIMLIPGLFVEFHTGRLFIIAGLLLAVAGCAIAASRNLRPTTK